MKAPAIFITAFMIILSACASTVSPSGSSPEEITPSPSSDGLQSVQTPVQGENPDMTPPPSTPSNTDLKNLVENAKANLAIHLSIPTTDINVLDARNVVWSNSSLGCPQPGMLYAEVLTPGYLILLNVDGQDYEYHAGRNSGVFLCENPIPPVPGMPGDT